MGQQVYDDLKMTETEVGKPLRLKYVAPNALV